MDYFGQNQKIGIVLLVVALALELFGIILLFDRSLFLLANLSFLIGMCLLVGVFGSLGFFMRQNKRKGSGFYFLGLFVIFLGFPLIGFTVQLYGVFLLFKSLLYHIYCWGKSLPVIGDCLRRNKRLQQFIERISYDKGGKPKQDV